MAFSLSKLSPDRLQGVHPDLVGMVERAIQITTQDFRVQESCACVSARPSWSRAAPAGPCTSGISPATPSIWRRRTERSAGRGRTTFGSPPRCRPRRMSSRPRRTASPTSSRPAGHVAAGRSSTARISSCRGSAGIIDWIKTAQGAAAILAAVLSPFRPPHRPRTRGRRADVVRGRGGRIGATDQTGKMRAGQYAGCRRQTPSAAEGPGPAHEGTRRGNLGDLQRQSGHCSKRTKACQHRGRPQ